MMDNLIEGAKRLLYKRGPVFEVRQDTAGLWYTRERASNGELMQNSQQYHGDSSKSHAVAAAKRLAANTTNGTYKVLPPTPKLPSTPPVA